MAALSRRFDRSQNIWPGFVDGLAALLMVVIFLLMVFVLAQFFLNEALSGRDEALEKLQGQVSELADMLALERGETADLRLNVSQLSDELQASVAQRDDLQSALESISFRAESAEEEATRLNRELEEAFKTIMADKAAIAVQVNKLATLAHQVEALEALKAELQTEIAGLSGKLDKSQTELDEERKALLAEKDLSDSARAQVALLNRQMRALREQVAGIARALDASELLAVKQKVQIAAMGKRLNAALASKVQELSRYRSEFFGRLRELLGKKKGVRIVGDRFVFQSEVLFASGSAELQNAGTAQLKQLAQTLLDLAARIPSDIDWVLRIDGHTDKRPIRTAQFPSNWELSTARAISVVKFMIEQGIATGNLAATGFGEFQPIDPQDNEDAYRRNRRIEFKLTQR
ncbi:MAG: peptidoglycan -binding protein [Rhodospirillales bacterium]|jgi:chemotaxis protein MotB|nr:peptidoglycan -binding protein [Rhodospirillales bacterium]